MSLPGVTQSIRDGALQSQPTTSAGFVPVLIGASSAGPFTPVTIAGGQLAELSSTFGRGPLVHAAARIVAAGKSVVVLRANATTAGAAGTVAVTNAGTSVVTATGAAYDTHTIRVAFITGGTVGTAGITFRYSIDNGRTYSPPVALGTANSYAVPLTNVTLNLAAGTVLATTTIAVPTTEPAPDADDYADAVEALRVSTVTWDWIQFIGPVSAATAATLKSELDAFEAEGVYTRAMAEARRPNAAESLADWRTSILADYEAFTSLRLAVGAGECLYYSPVDRKSYLRPATWPIALRAALVDPARYNIHRTKEDGRGGPLDCALHDAAGNPLSHDERTHPSLDTTGVQGTARFMTLRTFSTKGRRVYCTRAVLMSPPGSDFQTFRHGLGMDIACRTTQRVLTDEVGETPLTERSGDRIGKVTIAYAKAVESACATALREALITPGRVSDAYVEVGLNDNVLSTKTVNVKTYVQPTADADYFVNELAFVNPALAADSE